MRTIRLDNERVVGVYTTDWHLSDQPPGSRTGNYREEILEKVRFTRDLAVRLGGVGWFGGDLLHSKSPRSPGNTFSLINYLIELLKSFPEGTLFGPHGNHDVYMDRTDSIPHQPIGTLIASGALTDLSSESVIFENRDGSVRVQVDAYPYADDMVTLHRVLNAAPREPNVQYRVVLMHQYGNPGGQGSMFGHPTIGYDQMKECDYDIALWGHDHSRAETTTVGNCTHIRLGSLSRASLAEDEVDRPVNAAVLSFGTDRVRFKEVPVPTKPLVIAFAAADKQVEKVRASEQVQQFFQEMDATVSGIQSTDPREIMQHLCGDDRKLYDRTLQLCGF